MIAPTLTRAYRIPIPTPDIFRYRSAWRHVMTGARLVIVDTGRAYVWVRWTYPDGTTRRERFTAAGWARATATGRIVAWEGA